MRIGIVGSEAAKFTPETEALAKATMMTLVSIFDWPDITIVSGHCHLGGIDIWAEEMADACGFKKDIYPPKIQAWEGGYKQRNLDIARNSDVVYCITVKDYHPGYTGMRFKYCYHCKTDQHVKSGGCWTVKQAIKMGKRGEVYVI